MTVLEELVEYRRTHHYIPPEKIIAAYAGLHVDKINPDLVLKMDLREAPFLILDHDMKLAGVSYGHIPDGYIEIEHEDPMDYVGSYLYKPDRDKDGKYILPHGWMSTDDAIDAMMEDCDLFRDIF